VSETGDNSIFAHCMVAASASFHRGASNLRRVPGISGPLPPPGIPSGGGGGADGGRASANYIEFGRSFTRMTENMRARLGRTE